jgi:hypothetical protein
MNYETIVNLITKTTTKQGLKVKCRLDRRNYKVGRKVTDKEMAFVQIMPMEFHGEWNYIIRNHKN